MFQVRWGDFDAGGLHLQADSTQAIQLQMRSQESKWGLKERLILSPCGWTLEIVALSTLSHGDAVLQIQHTLWVGGCSHIGK